MRIVFCGTPESAVPSLDAIVARKSAWEVVAVLTQPDRRAGRGLRPSPSPVKERALAHDLAVQTPSRLRDVRETLESLAPDVIAVVAYGHIFRKWLLELPPLGCVNLHFSLLPRHRGVAPVAWAILAGDEETGVTTMRMDRGVDTGPLFRREAVPIKRDDTRGSLTARLAERGGPLLVETLAELEAGKARPQSQDETRATYARKLEKEDGRVDWRQPAAEIERRVRGLHPWPGAFTTFRGKILKVHAADARSGELPAGAVRERDGHVVVGTGDGLLGLREVQMSGKPRLSGEAWFRGARARDTEALGVE
jgi:methionyl-tRNA formyltransferase